MTTQADSEILTRVGAGTLVYVIVKSLPGTATPVKIIALVLFLVGIPLAITAQRKETSVGIALSLIVAFSYFIIIVITDNVKHKPNLHPEYLIWLPNFVYLMLGGTLFFRLARR